MLLLEKIKKKEQGLAGEEMPACGHFPLSRSEALEGLMVHFIEMEQLLGSEYLNTKKKKRKKELNENKILI